MTQRADVQRDDAAGDRQDDIRRIVEHCTAARTLAEGLDRRFLAYLIGMAIQDAAGSLPGEAGPPRPAAPGD